jgi:hypothetical protein
LLLDSIFTLSAQVWPTEYSSRLRFSLRQNEMASCSLMALFALQHH